MSFCKSMTFEHSLLEDKEDKQGQLQSKTYPVKSQELLDELEVRDYLVAEGLEGKDWPAVLR
jgi:hypothetical protein